MDLRYNSDGFLPDVGLYRRGGRFYQAMSRSHYWLLGIVSIGAVIVALLPWHTRAAVGELKYWISGMFLFGGLCDLVGSLVRKAVTQEVSIDASTKTISIVGDRFSGNIPWEQIIGLQICRQKDRASSELNGYQLNLVWRDGGGVVRRHCLLKHSIRGFVLRLGRRYQTLLGFALFDHSSPGRAEPHCLQT